MKARAIRSEASSRTTATGLLLVLSLVVPSASHAKSVYSRLAEVMPAKCKILAVADQVCLTHPVCGRVLSTLASDAETHLIDKLAKALRDLGRSLDAIGWVSYGEESDGPPSHDDLVRIAQFAQENSCDYILRFASHAYYR